MYSSKILDTSNTDWMAEAKGGGRGVYVMNISQGQTKEQSLCTLAQANTTTVFRAQSCDKTNLVLTCPSSGRCVLFFPNKDDAAFAMTVLIQAGAASDPYPLSFGLYRLAAPNGWPRFITAHDVTTPSNASASSATFPAPAPAPTVENPSTPAPAAPASDQKPPRIIPIPSRQTPSLFSADAVLHLFNNLRFTPDWRSSGKRLKSKPSRSFHS
ncbi:hypothetical protein PG987_000314 [Apiospora arundinis]